MSQSVIVSRVETEGRFVEFEGPTGNLWLSLKRCRGFFYEDYRNATVKMREAAEELTLAAHSSFPNRRNLSYLRIARATAREMTNMGPLCLPFALRVRSNSFLVPLDLRPPTALFFLQRRSCPPVLHLILANFRGFLSVLPRAKKHGREYADRIGQFAPLSSL